MGKKTPSTKLLRPKSMEKSDQVDFVNLLPPDDSIENMGDVSSAATSTQEELTLQKEEFSEIEFKLSPKLRNPGLKTTGLSEDESGKTREDAYNLQKNTVVRKLDEHPINQMNCKVTVTTMTIMTINRNNKPVMTMSK